MSPAAEMTDHQDYCDYLKKRRWTGWAYRRFLLYPRLASHLKGRILDVGCGIGDFLSHRSGTIGVDINERAVEHCIRNGHEAYVLKDDRLPFPDASFDGALLDNVLEHVAHPGPLLSEIRRILKPSGSVLVGVPGRRGFLHDPDHKVFYDRRRLETLLKTFGFMPRRFFFTPLRFFLFDRLLRQYCLYGVFHLREAWP